MSAGFEDFLEEQFAVVGDVTIKRMFGGLGVMKGGVMFALASDDTLYFRTDEAGAAAFVAEGCEQFAMNTKAGRVMTMPYWRAPERLYEDADDFREWSERAIALAIRDKAAKARPKKKR